MENNNNTFLAIGLSILVIIAWQYFYVAPRVESEQRAAQIEAQRLAEQKKTNPDIKTETGVPSASDKPVITAEPAIPGTQQSQNSGKVPRQSAVDSAQRVNLETDSLIGSINLKGARVDDLRLKKYRETIEPDSALIELFSPKDTKNAYFAEFGFAGEEAVGGVPGPDTVWTSEGRSQFGNGDASLLSWTNAKGVVFKRKIEVDDNYMFTFTDSVTNNSGEAITISPWGRIAQFYEPESRRIYVLHEGLIGFLGEEGLQEYGYDDMRDDKQVSFEKTNEGWLGITDKYWATALIPTVDFKATFSFHDSNGDHFQTHFVGDAITIKSGASSSVKHLLFAGAKETNVINDYTEQLGLFKFDFMIDWGWFAVITKPLFWVLDNLNKYVGNFGVAILITTILVKIIFFPLANLSYASMAKMKKVQPEMTKIRELYADDKPQQQKEMMALYRKEKINPAAGCWPMLIQIPVFFALYKVIYITIELRHAPFFGWIKDLSAPDPTSLFNLFGLIPFELPQILMIGIWPLLMGITMFLQMRMNPAPPDATQAMIFNWMPIVFTFMLASFPVGLVIYWAWNNTLTIFQQGFIMKKHGVKIELFDNLVALVKRKKNSSA
ncbi:MAG: membrane protein insertase YidC [Hyphomicrobiales bacterium]|nr:membrane protein insertase YidC [Hyphomicrobiales bacterium]